MCGGKGALKSIVFVVFNSKNIGILPVLKEPSFSSFSVKNLILARSQAQASSVLAIGEICYLIMG
jgi:hypothetical protein